jgi:DNA-binding response OmpR family regulator
VDGLQVLEQVRKKYPRLPVILLTGYGTIQSAIQALRLGAADYLLKPLDPEVLISRTRIALREQAVERRKKEIQSQIAALQAEYQTLEFESGSSPSLATMPVERILSGVKERFIKRGRLILDAQAQRATFGGRVLVLPPSAFDYLAVLANHSPDVVAYQDLVREAQGYQINSSEARELAKWHVHVLRQALEEDPQKPSWLLNLRGVGYRLLLE